MTAWRLMRLAMAVMVVAVPLGCTSPRGAAGGGDGIVSQASPVEQSDERPVGLPMPPAVIYKTSGDYYDNVPVGMDATRRRVVSYPAPSDLRVGGQLAMPVRLSDGYLLDRRGVNERTAFLDYTYEEYAALPAPPTARQLERHVIARTPFTEMYFVERRGGEDVAYYERVVASGFEGCERADLDTVPATVRLKVRE